MGDMRTSLRRPLRTINIQQFNKAHFNKHEMNRFFSKHYNQKWMNPKPKETKDQNIQETPAENMKKSDSLVKTSLGLAILGSGTAIFGMMMDLAINVYSQVVYSSKGVIHSKTADEIAIVGGGMAALGIISLFFSINKKENS